ncbi:hypothetical protein FNBNMHLP_03971 [Aeromonas jandaei]
MILSSKQQEKKYGLPNMEEISAALLQSGNPIILSTIFMFQQTGMATGLDEPCLNRAWLPAQAHLKSPLAILQLLLFITGLAG